MPHPSIALLGKSALFRPVAEGPLLVSMSFSWLLLLLSALALLAPLPIFYSRKRCFRSLHQLDIERRNGSRWDMLVQVFRFSGHWVELIRGLLASFCIRETIDDLRTVSQLYASHAAWARLDLPLRLATLSAILIAVLFRYPGKSIAPVAFVAATLLALVPPQVAVPALLLAGACAFQLHSLNLFFAILAPTLALLGLLLDRLLWPSVAGAVLAITPLAIAFFRHNELVIPVRRARGGG